MSDPNPRPIPSPRNPWPVGIVAFFALFLSFIAAFTGIVLSLQASYTFTGAVPEYFVGTLVGKTMLLELGPVLTGLALAGRVGASMAAELGTMKVTEQVDALETLAYDPQSYLVVPRVAAATLMFPAIVAFAIAVGIVTGWLTSLVLLDLSTPDFIKGLKLFYVFKDVWFGLLKSASFGCAIALVGCIVGLGTHGGAEGVGRSTTLSRGVLVAACERFLRHRHDCARVAVRLRRFAVRGRRRDGFHEVVTVLQTVSVFDSLRVGVIGPPGRGHHPAARRHMGLELRTDEHAVLPPPEENLALRAARAFGAVVGVSDVARDENRPNGLRTVIDIRKEIPVAGGMAGGSADAAGTLVALNELWGCELDRDQLRRLAAELGSDVPFCVSGGTALATGRGTALAQVLCRGTFHWVVCTAEEPLPTAAAYRAWDRRCEPSEVEPDAVLAALRNEDPEALGAALHNDLEAAAFHLRPELSEHRGALLAAGALGVVLSGSGPTLLALARSRPDAETIAAQVSNRFAGTIIASSPAGGPDVRPC